MPLDPVSVLSGVRPWATASATSALSPARALGTTTSSLKASALSPVRGGLGGAPLFVVDNPESFTRPGVLGSTIAAVPSRGSSRYQFEGAAQTFALAQNRTGAPQRFSNVLRNESREAVTVTVRGTVYMPTQTPIDGSIPPGYRKDGGFRGPQAIASAGHLDAVPGRNGYFTKTVKVPAGGSVALTDTYHPPGAEVFSRLQIDARTASGAPARFALAAVSSPKSLVAADFARLAQGTYPAAGQPSDFAAGGGSRLGRPNGVVAQGGTFSGGRAIDVSRPGSTGDLIWATRFKNAGSTAEIAELNPALANPSGVDPAASTDEGNYGVSYDLRYPLRNDGSQPRQVEVRLSAPITDGRPHHPDGGELTTALRVNGKVVRARVDQRGAGTVVATVTVPPRSTSQLRIELTNFGNNFPPAGIELHTR